MLPPTVQAQLKALLIDTGCKSTIQKRNTLRALVDGWCAACLSHKVLVSCCTVQLLRAVSTAPSLAKVHTRNVMRALVDS